MLTIGTVFTRLTVLREVPPPKEKKYAKNIGKWYQCQCSCNNKTIIITSEYALKHSITKSCGCLRSENSRKQIVANRQKMIENGNTTAPKTKLKMIEYKGEMKSCSEWARELGISRQALHERLKKHTPEEALSDIDLIREGINGN